MNEEDLQRIWQELLELDVGELMYQDLYDAVKKVVGVVEYKDRLTRFCFEVFEAFFNSHGVEIECVEEVFPKSFENELVEDMLSLLSSFSFLILRWKPRRSGRGGKHTPPFLK